MFIYLLCIYLFIYLFYLTCRGVRKIFWFVQAEVAKRAPNMQISVMANLFFLRFLVPCLLTPRLGGTYPSLSLSRSLSSTHHTTLQHTSLTHFLIAIRDSDRRTVSLISKLVLNLMNGIHFGEKESAMVPLNPFITPQRRDSIIQFFHHLTVSLSYFSLLSLS